MRRLAFSHPCQNTMETPNSPKRLIVVAQLCPTLWPNGLQHARLPYPSPFPGVGSNSCPLSRWCHPTTSSSVTPFSCPQSFPASGSFPKSWLLASALVLPVNIQGWFPLGLRWFDLLTVQGALKSLLQHHGSKASILWCSAFLMVPISHPYILLEKTSLWLYEPLSAKWHLCFFICCLGWS